MSNTTVDLNIGLNLQLGSIPVALCANIEGGSVPTTIIFEGCVQTAEISLNNFISYIGQQFNVDVQLPPELNLEAKIDYLVGQVTYTPSGPTELSVSAKFDLEYQNGDLQESFELTFYAGAILQKDAPATGNPYVVGGAIDKKVKFSNLPLAGDVPVFNQYIINHLGFSYTKEEPQGVIPFNIPKVTASSNPLYTMGSLPSGNTSPNSQVYSINNSGSQTTFNLSKKGFSLTAGLIREDLQEVESNFSLPMGLQASTSGNRPAQFYNNPSATVQTSPASTPIHWININKTFGPVDLQKIGLNYSAGEATFGLCAGFTVGGFSMMLEGLSVTFPLPLPNMPAGKTLSFDLNGLGLDFSKGAIDIGGNFLKVIETVNKQNFTNYFGEAIVEVGNYGLTAIGGYAPAQNGDPASFFLYANLEGPLGGPPFLYITGLAFGFGVNYSLNLPTISTLPGYLLLPANAPTPAGNAKDTMSTVLPQLVSGNIITNEPGEDWLAAGVEFTSFNMISAFALVTVSFGVNTEIGILGSCSITLPKGDPQPLAYVDIDLLCAFDPSSGVVPVFGVISPSSYILSNAIRLTGGFAFCIWYSGEHSGDFVFTVGGYNPSFTVPTHYPTVPRIAINFSSGPFNASGSAYLALTPGMFMAGIQYSATWSFANISAWYSAGADFLITWSPFTYRADAYISVGCSVDLALFTVHASIGADAVIWGPSFGGEVHVDLDVVSFTIHFGSSQITPVPVSWSELEEKFLQPSKSQQSTVKTLKATPGKSQNPSNVGMSIAKGLRKTNVIGGDGNIYSIIDPNHFEIVTSTKIPANNATWINGSQSTDFVTLSNTLPVAAGQSPQLQIENDTATFSGTQIWNTGLFIRPMNLSQIQSTHNIQLLKADETGNFNTYITDIRIEPLLQNSNAALWGDPAKNNDSAVQLLSATLVGFKLLPPLRNPSRVNNIRLIDLLFAPGDHVPFTYTSAQPDTNYTVTSSVSGSDLQIGISGQSTQNFTDQNCILSSLTNSWVTTQRNTILNDLLQNGFSTYASSDVNPTIMGSEEQLTDWPLVNILGASTN